MLYQVVMLVQSISIISFNNVHFMSHRRDKVFCHECRFCCSLSVCTNQHGTYFRQSSEKNLTGSSNKALGAITGYSLDMELYKKPDYRCPEWSTLIG